MSTMDDDTPSAANEETRDSKDMDRDATPRRPTVDEMSEWSFPASDPPATWNWEPRRS
jgi:hypothetical protein